MSNNLLSDAKEFIWELSKLTTSSEEGETNLFLDEVRNTVTKRGCVDYDEIIELLGKHSVSQYNEKLATIVSELNEYYGTQFD